jgi:hypothetical protein
MASLLDPNGTVASARRRPRADRNFHLAVALTVMLIVGIGFGRTVNANLFHPPSPRPWILHLYGLPALALGQAATMWIYWSRAAAWVAIAHALLR